MSCNFLVSNFFCCIALLYWNKWRQYWMWWNIEVARCKDTSATRVVAHPILWRLAMPVYNCQAILVHLSLAHRVVAFRINIGQYLSRNVWIHHNTRSVTFLRCDARKIINTNANVNCAAITTIKLKYILGKYWFYSRKIDKISINNKNINIFFIIILKITVFFYT